MGQELRHHQAHWYQEIFFNSLFQFVAGYIVVVLLPNSVNWFSWTDLSMHFYPQGVKFNTLIANSLAFSFSFFLLQKFKSYPGSRSLPFIIPTTIGSWMAVFLVLIIIGTDSFSSTVLVSSFGLANLGAFLAHYLAQRYNKLSAALVPFGRIEEVAQTQRAIITILDKPDLEGRRYDGIVVDLYAEELTPEWQRFLARCTMQRIPVYDIQNVMEIMTGRVNIDFMSENIYSSLLPSNMYSVFKRLTDTALVLLSAPLWLPLMLITGLIIKLESKGPMFFMQERVGQYNKDFKVYKLRSMCQDSEKDGAQFAQANDMRITRVGKIIRKTRIDEIPQFINVLKGEMSLIGPRPEQRAFVTEFENEMPFYTYRHVVKPGITGWAQVVQGYAADADDTQVKIAYDFYYIKHFSYWLDMLIVAKTIRTILTGFGAR